MHRTERIADTLREEIAQIVGYELEDPRLTMVTVTEVRVADDLRVFRGGAVVSPVTWRR